MLLGLEVRRVSSTSAAVAMPTEALKRLLDMYSVDIIFDIGANIGMSGQHFRRLGYEGTIVSFEPVGHLFETLRTTAAMERRWHVEKTAIGATEGSGSINVSGGHAGASSLLPMTDHTLRHAPDQKVVCQELINVTTLDAVMRRYYPVGCRAFLKIDVQGFEKNVLAGAQESLKQVVGMQVEMSLVQNYEGEPLFLEMFEYIESLGFRLVHIHDGWMNESNGQLFQVDGLFFRTELLGDGTVDRIPAAIAGRRS